MMPATTHVPPGRRICEATRSRPHHTIAGVAISNPDKVLFPDIGLTKRELCEYYEAIAPLMLPHVSGRPLTLVRCPTARVASASIRSTRRTRSPTWVDRIEVPGQ